MMRSRFKDSRRPYFWCEHGLLDLGLKPPHIAVYCLLAAMANGDDQCWPSYNHIAGRLGIGKRTAMRAVDRLIKLGLLTKTPNTAEESHPSSNTYELVDHPQPGGGATVAPGGDKSAPGVVPQGHRGWCHQSTSNKEPLNKEPKNKGERTESDPLLELFAVGFKQRFGHRPRFNNKQKRTWLELRQDNSEAILKAKIDAWWTYPLPRTFNGNRTFGAFLQWFDDIPVNGTSSASSLVARSAEEWLAEMKSSSAAGRQHYQELTNGITDLDAKIRTLKQIGGIHDDEEALILIGACDPGGCTTGTDGAGSDLP